MAFYINADGSCLHHWIGANWGSMGWRFIILVMTPQSRAHRRCADDNRDSLAKPS